MGALSRQAPSHNALIIREFLAKNNITVMDQPYSPDLAPCDFFVSKTQRNH